jgi:UDP-N-acetylglucosamine 4,6-dehydratase (inverting)
MNIFKNSSILITGGTGTFGKSFIKFLLKKKFPFSKIIVFSRDEFKQYQLSQELNSSKLRFWIGDIRDKDRLEFALRNVDYIVHAAALKQVPAAEYNPTEFIKTNVIGAQNLIECSLKTNVKALIALSTDKACSPINLYGATKLCADKLFVSANKLTGSNKKRFSVVRYGNVLGSRGSVLSKFLETKRENKPFPITDFNMTRFNILLKEAIEMVLWSLIYSKGGEILIPKLKSYNIIDFAKAVSVNAKFIKVGVREGEKIHEEMISEADSYYTYEYGKYFAIIPDYIKKINFRKKKLKRIKNIGQSYNSNFNPKLSVKDLRKIIKSIS